MFLEQGHSNFALGVRNELKVGNIEEGEVPEDIKIKESFNWEDEEDEEKKANAVVTYAELMKHSSKDDAWIEVEGIVYDVSYFMDEHPGGPAIIL